MCSGTSRSNAASEGASGARRPNGAVATSSNDEETSSPTPSWFQVRLFGFMLAMDLIFAVLFFTPVLPSVRNIEGVSWSRYTIFASVYDLAILAGLRVGASVISLFIGYSQTEAPKSPFDPHHKNGDKKTREELEEEALEESLTSWFKRYASQRPSFPAEVVCLLTCVLTIVKCLARLDVELGAYATQRVPLHPILWLGFLWTCFVCILVTAFLESATLQAGERGRARRAAANATGQATLIRRIRSNLSIPLLSAAASQAQSAEVESADEEQGTAVNSDDSQAELENPEDVRAAADITGDSSYKANWTDLLSVIRPDVHYVACASVFLVLAATAQIYIPRYTGDILDSLAETFAAQDGKDHSQMSMWDVPGFINNVVKLVVAAVLCGIFSACRGSIFTIVGGRVNVRLRVQLMDSLLAQDIGFFDVTKTGDITSRLTSDTTLVGDQVQLNVNVFLRSLVQMIGVLIFMFLMSWQLSLLAFISVPVITIMSKWYGNYVRSLTKLMQKKLADGNSVSEAAMGSMSTVRAFDAAESELSEFEKCMQQYLDLNVRSSIAYLGYCSCVTALPNLVTAVVLFYGGLLVRNGDMTSGNLVSFLLYLQSLSDSFASIGYIFSSLTQAVGAADKVFELMNRKPKLREPSVEATAPFSGARAGILGVEATKTAKQRQQGIVPTDVKGEVSLNQVEMYYPARPQRKILDGLSIQVPAGSVVAFVGPSGSGKSSVMSLIQHLYEPRQGSVTIDGIKVENLSPQWLSRNVSVVSQEPTLFARSIARNIMYGLEGTDVEPDMEQIQEAARLANAAAFIEGLPFGYETNVGERGVQLSGGQKQRIAIARALVRKPRILLLDEATSALDAESEALVQEAIDDMLARSRGGGSRDSLEQPESKQAPRMTVLIVAHRLSTVRNADIIFVIKDGKVVEQGSHEELVRDVDGEYTNLINRQMHAQMKLEAGSGGGLYTDGS